MLQLQSQGQVCSEVTFAHDRPKHQLHFCKSIRCKQSGLSKQIWPRSFCSQSSDKATEGAIVANVDWHWTSGCSSISKRRNRGLGLNHDLQRPLGTTNSHAPTTESGSNSSAQPFNQQSMFRESSIESTDEILRGCFFFLSRVLDLLWLERLHLLPARHGFVGLFLSILCAWRTQIRDFSLYHASQVLWRASEAFSVAIRQRIHSIRAFGLYLTLCLGNQSWRSCKFFSRCDVLAQQWAHALGIPTCADHACVDVSLSLFLAGLKLESFPVSFSTRAWSTVLAWKRKTVENKQHSNNNSRMSNVTEVRCTVCEEAGKLHATSPDCQHVASVCAECHSRQVDALLKSNTLPTCPVRGCRAEYNHDSLQMLGVSAEMRNKWNELSTNLLALRFLSVSLGAKREEENINWESLGVKRCPNCKTLTQRDGGCKHMTCRAKGCGHEWFWCCSRSYRVAHEASAHNADRECGKIQ